MTQPQLRILTAIAAANRYDVRPSLRELMRVCGLRSTHSVSTVIGRLVRDGFVTMAPGAHRTLRVTPSGLTCVRPTRFIPVQTCACGVSRVGPGACVECGQAVAA